MAVIHIKATGTCAGGNHVSIQADLDSGMPQNVMFAVEQMTEPLTVADVEETVLPLIRLHARGKTTQQLRNDLLAGITVTI